MIPRAFTSRPKPSVSLMLQNRLKSTMPLIYDEDWSSSIDFAAAKRHSSISCTWPRPVYIRSMGAFLPNDPVSNDDIEDYIGRVEGGRTSTAMRSRILRSNGIKQRYYAKERGTRQPTHLGVDLSVKACEAALLNSNGCTLDEVGMLATGTTTPDVSVPGFANLLHGKLYESKNEAARVSQYNSMDCLTSSGVCISGISAMKSAAHAVTLGQHERAMVVGCEVASQITQSQLFNDPSTQSLETEFLRYMLSDGASCALLDSEPNPDPNQLSFRLEAFYHHSFAHELPPTMVMGVPEAGKSLELGRTHRTASDFSDERMKILRQNIKMLNKHIMVKGREALQYAIDDCGLFECLEDGDQFDWVLPHVSSYIFFQDCVDAAWDLLGVPAHRVWTNLETVGNVGSASPFLLLWGALQEHNKSASRGNYYVNGGEQTNPSQVQLRKGQRVLLFVPESGQFSYHYVVLRVCDHNG